MLNKSAKFCWCVQLLHDLPVSLCLTKLVVILLELMRHSKSVLRIIWTWMWRVDQKKNKCIASVLLPWREQASESGFVYMALCRGGQKIWCVRVRIPQQHRSIVLRCLHGFQHHRDMFIVVSVSAQHCVVLERLYFTFLTQKRTDMRVITWKSGLTRWMFIFTASKTTQMSFLKKFC